MRRAAIGVVIAVAMVVAGARHAESDWDLERESLRGLKGVMVIVTLADKTKELGQYVDSSTLQAKVELKLRQAGVSVMSRSEMLADVRQPTLGLLVMGMPESKSSTAFVILVRLSVNQALWRLSGIKPVATHYGDTWARMDLLDYGTATLKDGALEKVVGDECDVFLNDWLASHPK